MATHDRTLSSCLCDRTCINLPLRLFVLRLIGADAFLSHVPRVVSLRLDTPRHISARCSGHQCHGLGHHPLSRRTQRHISTATYRLLSCHGIALITTKMESPIAPFAARHRCECMQRAASGELPDSDAHELGHRSASYRLHPHAHRAVQFKERHMRALDCIRPRELASRDHASPSKCARTVTAAR